MDEIQCVATSCWFVEAHAFFFLLGGGGGGKQVIFKGENAADMILKNCV